MKSILFEIYEQRKNSNPKYSLRAFARDLKISASSLNEFLKGKTGFSDKKIELISKILDWSELQKLQFTLEIYKKFNKKTHKIKSIKEKIKKIKFDFIDNDKFSTISSWEYFAVLECIRLKKFDHTAKFISETLNLSDLETLKILKHLNNLSLIKIESNKIYPSSDHSDTFEDIPSDAIKNSHLQLIEKSKSALKTQPLRAREFINLQLAFSSDDLIKAKERIRVFVEEFNDEFDKNTNKDKVYCLLCSFFDVAKFH